MDRRFAIALVLSFLVLMVFQVWLRPKPAPPPPGSETAISDTLGIGGPGRTRTPGEPALTAFEERPAGGDSLAGPGHDYLPDSLLAVTQPEELIPVRNNVAEAMFTDRGGRLVSWTLNDYRTRDGHPVELAGGKGELGIVLETEAGDVDLRDLPFRFRSETGRDGARVLVFEAALGGGTRVTKRFTIPAEGYLLDLDIEITGDERVNGYRLVWDRSVPPAEGSAKHEHSAMGSIALLGKDIENVRPGAFKKNGAKELAGNVRWAGVRNKYFLAAMVPPPETASRVVMTGSAVPENTGAELAMPLLRGQGAHSLHVYLGPLDYDQLRRIGYDLDRGVDLGYKFIRPLSMLLLMSMEWFYKFLPNFGVVIIVISALTKLVFYPLSRTSMRSMRAMQVIQPEMNALRDKYKGDPQRLQREMMELYKRNKVNPLGGCIPILVQMPVFFALYSVLANCIEMRQAPFFLWMDDLSMPDTLMQVGGFPIHVLPVVMFATTMLQQKLTPMTDARQKMMGYLMPVMMLFIFYSFPAGLNLYWTVNNVLTVAQQWHIHREVAREQAAA